MNAYTKHIKDQKPPVKEQVCHILGWTEKDYADFQFRMGTNYLQYYIPRDPQGIDMLVDSKIFWNWWRNHWMFRDVAYLQTEGATKCARVTALSIYFSLHHPDHLIGTIYPSSAVLHDSYAKMINQFQNNVK